MENFFDFSMKSLERSGMEKKENRDDDEFQHLDPIPCEDGLASFSKGCFKVVLHLSVPNEETSHPKDLEDDFYEDRKSSVLQTPSSACINHIKRKSKKKKMSQLLGVTVMNERCLKQPEITKKCAHCKITTTPQWRNGPMGQTLCNACGCGTRYRIKRNRMGESGSLKENRDDDEFQYVEPIPSEDGLASISNGCSKIVPHLSAPYEPTLERNCLQPSSLESRAKVPPSPSTPNHAKRKSKKKKTKTMSQILGATAMKEIFLQAPAGTKKCAHCEITKSPQWRKGPMGRTLCNACGVGYRTGHLLPEYRPRVRRASVPSMQHSKKCTYCEITDAPRWRRGPMGQTLCNACGVQYGLGKLFPEYHPLASPALKYSNYRKKAAEMPSGVSQEADPALSPPPEFVPMSSYLIDCIFEGSGKLS